MLVSHDQPGLLESYEVTQVQKKQEAEKHGIGSSLFLCLCSVTPIS